MRLKVAEVLAADFWSRAWWWKMMTLACWAMRIDAERAALASSEEAHRRYGPAVVLVRLQGGRASELAELRQKLIDNGPGAFEVVVEASAL